uniref:Uncharacterized protein n=1 Tax=Timema douglasi TaxID=61478 RepID=A0A7R8ZAL4_TIMDO|nr:unnamed protein product [Timema douglasi]
MFMSENRYECLRLSHHVDNFLGLKNFDKWLKFETQENRLYAVVMCLLEFPGLEKHDRFILETVSKYRFKDELPTNCAIFRALGNWHLLKDDKEGLNELDPEFVKLKELLEEHTGSVYHLGGPGLANIRIDDDREILEEHTGSVYHLGGSGLANIRIDDDREILKKYLEHLRSLPAPSPMSDIANRTVDRVLEKLRLEIMSIFYRELTPYPGKDLCKQPT